MSTFTIKSAIIEIGIDPRDSIQGVGPISVPGLVVGDRVFAAYKSGGENFAPFMDQYEGVISVADEIQQVAMSNTAPGQTLLLTRFG